MYKSLTAFSLFLISSALPAAEQTGALWSYSGQTAPIHWSSLDPHYGSCAGQNQSPINIERGVDAKLAPLKFNYRTQAKQIKVNELTLQVDFNSGASVVIDGQPFELKQFHIHTPSENWLHGKQYPLELHLVHANAQGELAVVALLYKQGQENKALNTVLRHMPKSENAVQLNRKINAAEILPKRLAYYRFNGSLTTPPCTEGVRWIVLKEIQTVSAQQLHAFEQQLEHPNNRPVQPQNARLVLE
ncbi:carbonic anhydrase [Acinetobacter pragensis]|uniref:Carbonic anhydrase n=1 Tax=Acinetobacter pragensis TaxID=1806892 RepID=A0A151XZI4_9GAMM|nr:carbonic anhydrase family protein [Acinetobacter pragensis]KYQ71233.1 carbonic anhydrase [Acinetobacter pragensis]